MLSSVIVAFLIPLVIVIFQSGNFTLYEQTIEKYHWLGRNLVVIVTFCVQEYTILYLSSTTVGYPFYQYTIPMLVYSFHKKHPYGILTGLLTPFVFVLELMTTRHTAEFSFNVILQLLFFYLVVSLITLVKRWSANVKLMVGLLTINIGGALISGYTYQLGINPVTIHLTPLLIGEIFVGTLLTFYLNRFFVSDEKATMEVQDAYEKESRVDRLTGLGNYRSLLDYTGPSLERTSMAVVCVADIDHFKHVNDTYGHQNGNVALQHFAHFLKELCEEADYNAQAFRYGGEEFCLVFLDTKPGEVDRLFELVRQHQERFKDLDVKSNEGETIKLTFSAGICEWQTGEELEDAFNRADKALYEAKTNGRDQVVVYHDDDLATDNQAGELQVEEPDRNLAS